MSTGTEHYDSNPNDDNRLPKGMIVYYVVLAIVIIGFLSALASSAGN
jgi:hypothetical protein